MSHSTSSKNQQIINLYTDLANHSGKDFGWEKGLQNALKHGYKKEWIDSIPETVWSYCAAVGNPFELGTFNQGDSVVDIGCGAGVDLCVASLLVGTTGHVYGIDLTPAMIEKAIEHAKLSNLRNITVHEGFIEKLPFDDESINTVISNGAINLSSSKEKVFSEISRVLASGGALYFADMIKDENYEPESKSAPCGTETDSCNTESWADCVSGTLHPDELLQMMKNAGFVDAELVSTTHYKTSSSTIGATFKGFKQ